jgi:hypothetical protein
MLIFTAMLVFAAMPLASTADRLSPRVTKTASMTMRTCRIDQFIATTTVAANPDKNKT